MNLQINALLGLVTLETVDKTLPGSFSFALNKGMYQSGDGVGCQVNDASLKADVEELGIAVAAALHAFGEKHPELGLLDSASTAVAQARKDAMNALQYGKTNFQNNHERQSLEA